MALLEIQIYNCTPCSGFFHYSRLFLQKKNLIMYYLSLVAYYAFFNARKVLHFVSLLVLASFHMFVLSRRMGNFQELAAFACEEKIWNNLFCLQFEVNPAAANTSFYEVPLLVSRFIWRSFLLFASSNFLLLDFFLVKEKEKEREDKLCNDDIYEWSEAKA